VNDEASPGVDKRPEAAASGETPAAAPQWLAPPGASVIPASPPAAPPGGSPPIPRDGGYAHSQGFSRNYVPPASRSEPVAPPTGSPPGAGQPVAYAPPTGYTAPYPATAAGYPPYGTQYAYAAPVHVNPPTRLTYDGKIGELYLVYLRSLLLTLLTFGIYRFWGRTRVRRYLWSHVSAFGDRFEYRGRGVELFLGFLAGVGFLMILGGVLLGALWLFARDSLLQEVDADDVAAWLLVLAGYPLLAVGRYAGMRYKLTRTRWRGIRSGLEGSAWKFGGISVGMGFLNGMCIQLLSPVVDVLLARYRLTNMTFGTVRFGFAGQAGNIYGRYIGFFCLNILAWIVLMIIIGLIIGGLAGSGLVEQLGGWEAIRDHITHPTPLVLLIMFVALLAIYSLIGIVILPLRCWYQAYLLRYLVSRTWFGPMQFVTGVTTGQMWGFLVLNWIILLFTLGFGWPWVLHRTATLVADQLWIYGEIDAAAVAQALGHGPAVGEGLLDLFDTGIL